jgi:protein-tyrosine phosphatase
LFGRWARRRWRWALHAWMTLIGLSILTTYQHHFIDLPTGLAVGFAVLWALPDESESPLRRLVFTADPARRRLALRYAIGAIVCIAFACLGGTWLWLFWPALALALVALNYAAAGATGFQKDRHGRLSTGARGLLLPYLIGARINSRLWTRRHPQPAAVTEDVWIGRIPSAAELRASPFAAIVDLSAELSCGDYEARLYRSFPVLDLTVPDAAVLRAAAEAIQDAIQDAINDGRQRGPVLVCCALGYSRSAAAIVAWLLMTRRAATVDEAMSMVRKARPAIVLRREHCTALEAFA